MATTDDTGPRQRTALISLGRALVGIAIAVAALAAGVRFAPDADAAARDDTPTTQQPRPRPCLNIVTCGTGTPPPGKVDPGPPRRQADLPTPSATVRLVEPYFTTTGRHVPQIEITNWKAYDGTLFASDRRYPACGEAGNRFRTWVDILDGESGRLHYRYCAMGTPIGLTQLRVFPREGHPIPERIAVRLVDNLTNRVVVSNPVDLPTFWRVGTRYSSAEQANLEFAAEYWDIPVHEVQKAGVMAIRFIHGVSGTTGSKPLRPRPNVEGRVTYTSDWQADEQHALEWVSEYHDLTYAETQKLGAIVMIYVAAVAQR